MINSKNNSYYKSNYNFRKKRKKFKILLILFPRISFKIKPIMTGRKTIKNVDLIRPSVLMLIFSSASKKIKKGVSITDIKVDAKVQNIDKDRLAPQI